MFFSKTIKQWKESRDREEEFVLLEEKEKARTDTLSTALFGFIMGAVGTLLLSGVTSLTTTSNTVYTGLKINHYHVLLPQMTYFYL